MHKNFGCLFDPDLLVPAFPQILLHATTLKKPKQINVPQILNTCIASVFYCVKLLWEVMKHVCCKDTTLISAMSGGELGELN